MTTDDVSFEFDAFPNPKIYNFKYKTLDNDIDDVSFPMEVYFPEISREIAELTKDSIETHRATLEALAH